MCSLKAYNFSYKLSMKGQSLIHTCKISTSTSTNARHTHRQNWLGLWMTDYECVYAWCLCLCLSYRCEPGLRVEPHHILYYQVAKYSPSPFSKALFTWHKLTRVSFCRVNTANPGSTQVKSNPPPEVGLTRVSLEKCCVNTNLGRTRISFDFAHVHL